MFVHFHLITYTQICLKKFTTAWILDAVLNKFKGKKNYNLKEIKAGVLQSSVQSSFYLAYDKDFPKSQTDTVIFAQLSLGGFISKENLTCSMLKNCEVHKHPQTRQNDVLSSTCTVRTSVRCLEFI